MCLATVHVAVCAQLALDGFVYSAIPTVYFQNQAQPIHVVQIAMYVMNVRTDHPTDLRYLQMRPLSECSGRWTPCK